MKNIHIILLLAGFALVSCSKPEPGAAELEILSKKLFDTMKTGDESKFQLLIPDEPAYTLYTELVKKDSATAVNGIKIFDKELINEFNTFRSSLQDISGATHTNFNQELVKTANTSRAIVTTKFTLDGKVTKYRFDAIKLRGRWFCLGNFELLKPDNPS